jgi:hypothetical protein
MRAVESLQSSYNRVRDEVGEWIRVREMHE